MDQGAMMTRTGHAGKKNNNKILTVKIPRGTGRKRQDVADRLRLI